MTEEARGLPEGIAEIFRLDGQHAVVTGAASGLGKAIALGFAHFGKKNLLIRAFVLPAFLMLVAWLVYALVERRTIKPLTGFLANPLAWLRRWQPAPATRAYSAAERAGNVARQDLPVG